MKKLVALALALVLLLSAFAALAESTASTISLSDLSISYVEGKRARTAKLKGMSLSMALGSADGVASLQVNFDNGKGQVVDTVFQIVGTRLLMSVGGISGTYYVDLAEISPESGNGEMVAKGLSSLLTLAGPHLDVLLYVATTVDSKGVRSAEIPLPGKISVTIAESLLRILEGVDSVEDADVDELRERVEQVDDTAALRIAYDEAAGTFSLAIIQGGTGVQVAGNMELTVQPMTFVNISADEDQVDLMRIDPQRLEEMRGELSIIAKKFGSFSNGTGLSGILP